MSLQELLELMFGKDDNDGRGLNKGEQVRSRRPPTRIISSASC